MNDKIRGRNIQYERLLFIDKEISQNTYPSAPKLAKKYEASVITIKRDIEFMKSRLRAPIEYDKRRKGYFYGKTNFRLTLCFADGEELFAAGVAIKLLSQYRKNPAYDDVKKIFETFTKLLPNTYAENPLWFEKRIVYLGEPSPDIDKNIWHTVIKAMNKNVYADFAYKSVYNGERNDYHIAPYQIVCRKSVWYMAGYSKIKDAVSLYAMHRITKIKLSDEHFIMPSDYDYKNLTSGNFGVFTEEKKTKCKVKFFAETATYISERKWTEDQKIKYNKDGSIVITFTTGQIYETLVWILSQGANALPLSPRMLVSQWEKHAKKMYAHIRKIINK